MYEFCRVHDQIEFSNNIINQQEEQWQNNNNK